MPAAHQLFLAAWKRLKSLLISRAFPVWFKKAWTFFVITPALLPVRLILPLAWLSPAVVSSSLQPLGSSASSFWKTASSSSSYCSSIQPPSTVFSSPTSSDATLCATHAFNGLVPISESLLETESQSESLTSSDVSNLEVSSCRSVAVAVFLSNLLESIAC